MQFKFEQIDALPGLAWCARLQDGTSTMSVRHGPWVETRSDAFFEGAWDGDFERGRFDTAATFLGTGARLMRDGALFSTPTNQAERLYSIRVGDSLWLSNSMVFLLVEAGDGPDPGFPHYDEALLAHFQAGLLREIKTLPTRLGNRVRVHDYRNVLVRPDLSMRYRSKVFPEAPDTFQEYNDLLLRTIDSVFRNASDPARRRTYRPLSSVSAGYDSTAITALAKQCGCTEAFTFSTVAGEPSGDSGLPIADALGMRCTEHDLLGYRNLPGCPEAEFCASAPTGRHLTLAPLESLLESRLLLVGYAGGIFWASHDTCVRPSLAHTWRLGVAGDSVTEFRLRVGFHLFMVSYIGSDSTAALRRISESGEMQPWCLKTGEYDRPIPRRIAEEAGVPRKLFGHKKNAGGHAKVNKGLMTDEGKKDFSAFCERSVRPPGRLRYTLWGLRYRLFKINVKINDRLYRLFGDRLPAVLILPVIPARFGLMPRQYTYLFHWGFERIRSRYDRARD